MLLNKFQSGLGIRNIFFEIQNNVLDMLICGAYQAFNCKWVGSSVSR